MGFNMAGKKAAGGAPAPKQNKLMDNYGVFNLGNILTSLTSITDSKQWEARKVGKGKTPPLRLFSACYFDCMQL